MQKFCASDKSAEDRTRFCSTETFAGRRNSGKTKTRKKKQKASHSAGRFRAEKLALQKMQNVVHDFLAVYFVKKLMARTFIKMH